MWVYEQSTGRMSRDGELLAVGYAGHGVGKNKPELQHVHDTGPLPRGHYRMNAPVWTATHGPYVMWLTPASTNQIFGRSAFGIHGDSVKHPGTASLGCIVLPRSARLKMWTSGDHDLEVKA